MRELYVAFALAVLLTVIAGLVRIMYGPTAGDRMLAAQLFGTAGVAMLLLLGHGLDIRALQDVALVFALLATVTTLAFVRRAWLHHPAEGGTP